MVSEGTHETFKDLIISVLQTIPDHIAMKEMFSFFYEASVMLIPKANKDFTINKAIDMSHV